MIRNTFTSVCDGCKEQGDKEPKPRCATCAIDGTNAYGDRETRVLTLCGPCRRRCRGRCRLHPKHKVVKEGGACPQ